MNTYDEDRWFPLWEQSSDLVSGSCVFECSVKNRLSALHDNVARWHEVEIVLQNRVVFCPFYLKRCLTRDPLHDQHTMNTGDTTTQTTPALLPLLYALRGGDIYYYEYHLY